MLFQYHFKVNKTPALAKISAELEDGTDVKFDNDGKTEEMYNFETKITKIELMATGYEDLELKDHIIAAEINGDENTKEGKMEKLKVLQKLCQVTIDYKTF